MMKSLSKSNITSISIKCDMIRMFVKRLNTSYKLVMTQLVISGGTF